MFEFLEKCRQGQAQCKENEKSIAKQCKMDQNKFDKDSKKVRRIKCSNDLILSTLLRPRHHCCCCCQPLTFLSNFFQVSSFFQLSMKLSLFSFSEKPKMTHVFNRTVAPMIISIVLVQINMRNYNTVIHRYTALS